MVPCHTTRSPWTWLARPQKCPPCHCTRSGCPLAHTEVCSLVQWGCDSPIVPNQHLPALQLSTKLLQTSHKMQTACTTSHPAWQPQARKPPNTQLSRTHGTETHVWHMRTSHKPPKTPRGATIWDYFERCSCHRHENLPPMLTGHGPA